MSLAHERKRHCTKLLLKKLTFSPVVSIQGPRQCGKSYLAKKLLPQKLSKSIYRTLDEQENRSFAESNPKTFLTMSEGSPFIVDEVQKVPHLFDEIKAIVDDKRIPGQFLILGSTEFSHETQIRESLTGRLSRLRLFPFNLAETKKLDINPVKELPYLQPKPRVSRSDFLKYLEHGGFPGIFVVKNENERTTLLKDWLTLTCERDIHQIKKFKLDSSLTLDLLQLIATTTTPNLATFTAELRTNTKKIQNHLNALKTLFVIFEVSPARGSTGKSLYYLIDTGLLTYYRATFELKLLTWFYLEMLAQMSYKGTPEIQLKYFKSSTSSTIHFVFELKNSLNAIKIVTAESFDKRDFLIFDSLKKKYAKKYKSFHFYGLYGGKNVLKFPNMSLYPWEHVI